MSLRSILRSLFRSRERRVICPKCGAILSPKDPMFKDPMLLNELRKVEARHLGRILPISLECPTCGTMVPYDDGE